MACARQRIRCVNLLRGTVYLGKMLLYKKMISASNHMILLRDMSVEQDVVCTDFAVSYLQIYRKCRRNTG